MCALCVCMCVQAERHFIMQVLCEATQSSDMKVTVAALQNMVKIMSLYYQHMEMYMGPALFAVSPHAGWVWHHVLSRCDITC